MGKNFNLLAVLSLYLIGTGAAHALSCKSGDSSCSDQSATDCTALGYSTADVSNCKHYLYCPLNINYKTCVAFSENTCPDGYAKDVKNCGVQGSNGWSLRRSLWSKDDCKKCIKKSCPNNSSTEITSQADCQDGATYSATGYYSGDEPCGKCNIPCSEGYAKNADDCGLQGSNGWSLDKNSTDIAGCYKCTAKPCPSESATDKTCDAGYELRSTAYSGTDECFKCVPKSCPIGSSTSQNCSEGSKAVLSGDFSGTDPCYYCSSICSSGYSYHLYNKPTDCIAYRETTEGWHWLPTKHPEGWKIVNDENGCSKCEQKDCDDHGFDGYTMKGSLTGFDEIGQLCKTEEIYYGDELKICGTCIDCEDSKKSNPEGLPYTSRGTGNGILGDCAYICTHTLQAESYMPYYAYEIYVNITEGDFKDFKGRCYGWTQTPNTDDENLCCCAYNYGTRGVPAALECCTETGGSIFNSKCKRF